jgi:hypothetical protein
LRDAVLREQQTPVVRDPAKRHVAFSDLPAIKWKVLPDRILLAFPQRKRSYGYGFSHAVVKASTIVEYLVHDPRGSRAADDEQNVLAKGGPSVPEMLQRRQKARFRGVEPWNLVEENDLFADLGLFKHFPQFKESLSEFFKNIDFKKILSGIGKVFEVIGGIIFAIGTGPMAGLLSSIATWIQGLGQTLDGAIDIVSGFVSAVVALFQGDWQQVWESVKEIGRGIQKAFYGLYNLTIGPIIEFVMGVIDWFVLLWDELVGHSIVPDMIEAIIEWFLSLPGEIWGSVEEFASEIVSIFEGMWSDIKSWWSTNVAPKFTKSYWQEQFDVIQESVKDKLEEAKEAAEDKWGEVKSWYNTNVAPKFTKTYWMTKFDAVRSGIAAKLDEAKRAVTNKWTEIKSWFNTNVAPKFTKDYWVQKFSGIKDGLIQAIRNGINGAVEKINSFISWLNSHLEISLPAVTVAGKKVFEGASFQVVTIPSIPRFEQGGVLEDGLFTMNRGEIAGKFTNGTSVVANNQMIVEGIAAGVYQAVVAAMSDAYTGGSQNVNVYLDGKQIYASVKKTETERGRNLMGNQLGYSY